MQQVADALGQVRQLNRTASILRRGIQRHQGPEPTAIDVIDTAQVEHNVFIVWDQFLNRVTQAGGLFAENNAAATIDDQNTIYGSSTQSKLHRASRGFRARRLSPKGYRLSELFARTS